VGATSAGGSGKKKHTRAASSGSGETVTRSPGEGFFQNSKGSRDKQSRRKGMAEENLKKVDIVDWVKKANGTALSLSQRCQSGHES